MKRNIEQKDMIDFLGNQLEVGDKVVYSNGASDKTMRIGTIIQQENAVINWKWSTETNKNSQWTKIFEYGLKICVKGEKGHIYSITEFFTRQNREKLSLIKILN